MLTQQTHDTQANAFENKDQTLQDQYQVIQAECIVLRKRYQALYEQHQALLERSPIRQGKYVGTANYHQTLQDYRQSQQEHRRLIQHFRGSLHKHRIITTSYRSKQNSQLQARLPFIRKTILLGVGNAKDADLLKESVQRASAHRVFLAADSSQVLCMLQNVRFDLLVLDDGLFPLPGIELYYHLHRIKGLESLPAIIMSNDFYPYHQAELTHDHLIQLEKPIKAEALMKAIDRLLV